MNAAMMIFGIVLAIGGFPMLMSGQPGALGVAASGAVLIGMAWAGVFSI